MLKIDTSELYDVLHTLTRKVDALTEKLETIKEPDRNQEIMTVTEAAKFIKASRSTVTRLFYEGAIKGYQQHHGSKIYLYRKSILEFVKPKNLK